MSVNFTGIWKADLSISRLPNPAPLAITVKIQHADPELRQEIVVTQADGNQNRGIFQCRTDGEEDRSLLNGKPIHGVARWKGNELVMESWILAGTREKHFCDYWSSLSPDGQTLTMEHRYYDLAGQLTVLQRA